jgi:SAM-dependent methyltransferase
MLTIKEVIKPPLKRLAQRLPEPAPQVARGLQAWVKRVSAPFGRLRLTIGKYPLSYLWGSDRGLEIARFYLERQFFPEFSSDIRGHCLEFGGDYYASRFGGEKVVELDILDKGEDNPQATLVADLTGPNKIPNDLFDCIICTHVLHLIFEVNQAVMDLHRILKPGGILLVAVPHVSMCDPGWHECYRFTQEGLYLTLVRAFGENNVTMRAYGNSLTAAGEIRGLAAHEFTQTELNHHDHRFAVEICARAMKKS